MEAGVNTNRSNDENRAGVSTLFLAGELDPIATVSMAAKAQSLVPGSRLEVLPGVGHLAYFEQPDVFNAIVEASLSEPRN